MRSSTDVPTILQRLLKNNAQWAEDVESADAGFFNGSARDQNPQVLWIGCADSRVPESIITRSQGRMFVHRNIANQVREGDDNVAAILDFAVAHLGVQHVIVVGHTACGGVEYSLEAAINGQPPPPPEGHGPCALERWLSPLTQHLVSHDLSNLTREEALLRAIQENVRMQVDNVCKSPTMREIWSQKRNVWVHGWVYDLGTGRLRDLKISRGPPK